MSENRARLERDLYDYEHDEPRTSGGRRRRPVADWGVGDDVFETMPRNRFSRVADAPARERRFATHEERRAASDDEADDRRAVAERRDAPERGERPDHDERAVTGVDQYGVGLEHTGEERPARRDPGVPRGRVDDGRRTVRIGRPEDVPSEIAAITADRDIDDEPAPAADPPAERPAPGERRTIRIGGRPEGSLEATRAQRRRPPRTAHERVGARPDRVAAYAVALGLLLILIAVVSAL